MQGSSPQATVAGTHVIVQGPFPPGNTFVQVACALPAASGDVEIEQRFPAALEQLAVVVKKVGDTTLRVAAAQASSGRCRPTARSFIAATGGAVAAGQPIELDGRRPAAPQRRAAAHRAGAGDRRSRSPASGPRAARPRTARRQAAERKRLIARREKLFNELVRLEQEHRSGRVDDRRYATRREELVAALEQIYGALDGDEIAEPARAAT